MVPESSAARLKACHCCGLVQSVGPVPAGHRAVCVRCRATLARPGRSRRSNRVTAALATAALILWPLAISLPIMTITRFGHRTAASIWTGSWSLVSSGEVFVGGVVLVCSIFLPLGKLLGLFAITAGPGWLSRGRRALWYRWIEWTGRWGMLDVLLLALLVAWVKVGDLVEVTPGPAALAFTLVVGLSLLASAAFDPHALWEEDAA